MRKSAFQVLGPELDRDLKEALDFVHGRRKRLNRFTKTSYRVLTPKDALAIRKKVGLSQAKFAKLLNASLSTIQAWEYGSRRPDGVASLLLSFIDLDPKLALRAILRARENMGL